MPKILIVEDAPEMRKLVRIILEPAGYTAVEAGDGQAGIEMARQERPDLILMDLSLPVMNGWDATRAIKSDADLRHTPVVALTAHAMQGDRERALGAGCDAYLTKPIDDELLLRTITDLLSQPATQPAQSPSLVRRPGPQPIGWEATGKETILAVDDNPQLLSLLTAKLQGAGYHVQPAASGEEALAIIEQQPPDLVILDVMLPDHSGYQVTEAIKRDPLLPFIPVILLTAGTIDREQGLEVGADDFLAKPVDSVELLVRVRSLMRFKRASTIYERRLVEQANLVEQSQSGILVVDPTGQVTAANGVALKNLGLSDDWVIGHHYAEVLAMVSPRTVDSAPLLPEDNPIGRTLINREVTSNQILTVRTPRGEEHVLQFNAAPLLNDQQFHGAVISFQDVTEIIRTQKMLAEQARELKEANEKLSALDQLKSRFISTVSHELRTPLNAISILVQILQRDRSSLLSETQEDAVRRLQTNTKFMTQMINDLLDYSRLVAGKQELKAEPLDPATLIKDVHDALLETATAKGLDFRCELAEDLPREVINDPIKLRQVLTNLIGNAIKYTERGRVFVSARSLESDRWCIEITDTGVGIPAEELPYIFDEFRQAHPESRASGSGTGLGLPITKRLVKLMHGEIEIHSQVGEGSVFTLKLPIVVKPVDPNSNSGARASD